MMRSGWCAAFTLSYAQDAIPEMAEAISAGREGDEPVDVYVSDMCLQDTQNQRLVYTQAVDSGVVKEGAIVIMTFKCTKGFSSQSYDQQVREQVDALYGYLRDTQVIHLIMNRNGERTCIGRCVRPVLHSSTTVVSKATPTSGE